MTRCKNCGHESHCGNPLRKAVDRSQPHAAGLTEIEVCKACRCALCEDKAKVIYKRYSELCYHDQSDWDWEIVFEHGKISHEHGVSYGRGIPYTMILKK